MKIERREFLEKTLVGAAGLVALMRGMKATAQNLPSDKEAKTAASGPGEIVLPAFEKNSAFTLDHALMARKTSRNFDKDAAITREQLSRILWAANGVNRPDGKRVTPSALHLYPISVYAALKEGVYLYQPDGHKLKRVSGQDIRDQIAAQLALNKAALQLLYVINPSKLTGADDWMAVLEIGCMVQDVYLQAAALGLGSCGFAFARYEAASKAMGLKSGQKLRFAQAVGPIMS